MKRAVVVGLIAALIVGFSMSIPFALDNATQHEYLIVEGNPSLRIVVNSAENLFVVEDENQRYDLFRRLIAMLYQGENVLYRDFLNKIEVGSIRRKYSDSNIYVVELEFSMSRCSQDVTGRCETMRGFASVEVLLGRKRFNEPLCMFSSPDIEVISLW